MKKVKVLFVSAAFPPKFDSESLQVERILQELLKRKQFDISVVTTTRKYIQIMPVSKGMEDFSQKLSSYFEAPVFESRLLNKLLGVVGLINIPDAKWAFTLHTKNILKNIPDSIDLVYSRSFPPSSSVLACKLVEKLNVPWLMHLSDPWFLNPTHRYSSVEKKINRQWEKRCLKKADLVSFTTEKTMDLYKSYYPSYSSKFFLSYNSVVSDIDKVSLADVVCAKKLKIVHAGLLNHSRNPDLLIQALRYIKDTYADKFEMLEVVFVGAVDRYVSKQLESNKDMISYQGVVEYGKSKELIASADLVLSFDNAFDLDDAAVFLPSKLLDYAVARKRILCITNQGSPSSGFVREVGGSVFEHTSLIELIKLICKAVEMKRIGEKDFFISYPLPERFTTNHVTDRLVEKIQLLTD